MAKKGVAAYIIFNTDPHNDEYIPREYHIAAALTGFTGENATVVVTQDFAGVWTDGPTTSPNISTRATAWAATVNSLPTNFSKK